MWTCFTSILVLTWLSLKVRVISEEQRQLHTFVDVGS